MCELAAEQTSSWLMVDGWEAYQDYQRTAVVLDHFDYEINTKLGGVVTEDGQRRNVHIMLLAGSDLIATMSEPGVWSEKDVSTVLHSMPFPKVSSLHSSSYARLQHCPMIYPSPFLTYRYYRKLTIYSSISHSSTISSVNMVPSSSNEQVRTWTKLSTV